ncbi:MAG: 3-hydroxybutyryl-CoA dehydrogenase [Ignavibacteriales bacterium]|nr:3-hydroxybutyryl-CoA dehydrogenase [Ignavibacteriales bacterium]
MKKQIKKKKSASRKRAATSLKSKTPKLKTGDVKQQVCLLGDEQLVREYSAIFQSNGIAVAELKNLSSLKSSAKKISIAFELSIESGEVKSNNLRALDDALDPSVPIVTNAVTSTVLSQAQYVTQKQRLIGIAAFPTLIENKLVEISPSLHTSETVANAVIAFFGSMKKESAIVEDGIGMVMPRILCQIINEALFTVQNDVANPKDIDTAMKLGTNYPNGPIEWGERIGFNNIVAVLDALYKNHGEERYRVAPLLRQMAIAGKFWKAAS